MDSDIINLPAGQHGRALSEMLYLIILKYGRHGVLKVEIDDDVEFPQSIAIEWNRVGNLATVSLGRPAPAREIDPFATEGS